MNEQVLDRTDAIRKDLIDVVKQTLDESSHFNLSIADDSSEIERLRFLRQRLIENQYNVLVMGEVKRGKSTFVNALIGQEVLPTDVDVATSQVFCIQHAPEKSYRLRFEDGKVQEVSFDDLSRYGSQTMIDKEGKPELSDMLRWIEIDVPARFLPPNVRLLDTPGLGALFAAHALITMRFVPQADAVVFVLSSGQPIVEKELEYLGRVLEGTSSLFIIQTKIDQHRTSHWQKIKERNQEILQKEFGDRITTDIWPISSTNLLKAGIEGDDDYLFASKYPELSQALKAFLNRVSGWGRLFDATVNAGGFHSHIENILQSRFSALSATNKVREQQISELQNNREAFLKEWGENSQRRAQLQDRVQGVQEKARGSMEYMLGPDGSVENQYVDAIYKCSDIEDLELLSNRLMNSVSADIDDVWKRVEEELKETFADDFGELSYAGTTLMETTAFDSEMEGSGINLQTARNRNLEKYGMAALISGAPIAFGLITESGLFVTVNTVWTTALTHAIPAAISAAGGSVVMGPGTFLVLSSAILWAPAILVSGYGIVKVVKSIKKTKARQLQEAKETLKEHLLQMLTNLYNYFLRPDPAEGMLQPRTDEIFENVAIEITKQFDNLVNERLQEVNGEINLLQEQLSLDEKQQQAEAEIVQGHLDSWNDLGAQLKVIGEELSILTGEL